MSSSTAGPGAASTQAGATLAVVERYRVGYSFVSGCLPLYWSSMTGSQVVMTMEEGVSTAVRGCDVDDRSQSVMQWSKAMIVGMWGGGGSVRRAVDKECSDCVGDVGVWWVVARTPTSFGRFRLI